MGGQKRAGLPVRPATSGGQWRRAPASPPAGAPSPPPNPLEACIDAHSGIHNRFQAYISGLARNLASSFEAPGFNQVVHSIHLYPFAVVIEKPAAPSERFADERHGTEWEPFFGQ